MAPRRRHRVVWVKYSILVEREVLCLLGLVGILVVPGYANLMLYQAALGSDDLLLLLLTLDLVAQLHFLLVRCCVDLLALLLEREHLGLVAVVATGAGADRRIALGLAVGILLTLACIFEEGAVAPCRSTII